MTTQERLADMKSLPGAPNNQRRRLKPLTRNYFVSEGERKRRRMRMQRYWEKVRERRA